MNGLLCAVPTLLRLTCPPAMVLGRGPLLPCFAVSQSRTYNSFSSLRK